MNGEMHTGLRVCRAFGYRFARVPPSGVTRQTGVLTRDQNEDRHAEKNEQQRHGAHWQHAPTSVDLCRPVIHVRESYMWR